MWLATDLGCIQGYIVKPWITVRLYQSVAYEAQIEKRTTTSYFLDNVTARRGSDWRGALSEDSLLVRQEWKCAKSSKNQSGFS